MDFGIKDESLQSAQTKLDEVVDRAKADLTAVLATEGADVNAKILQVSNIVKAALDGLQGTVDSAFRQAADLVEGWELHVGYSRDGGATWTPALLVRLTKGKQ